MISVSNDFEWDPEKGQINLEKHGVDFSEIIAIWDDPQYIEFKPTYEGEERFAIVGYFREKIWTVIATHRYDKIRLISARRAHKDEEELYYEDRGY